MVTSKHVMEYVHRVVVSKFKNIINIHYKSGMLIAIPYMNF